MNDELRIYIVMRTDLTIPPGKAMVQAAHAVSFLIRDALRSAESDGRAERIKRYLFDELQAKIVLDGKHPETWRRLKAELDANTIPFVEITDAARTVFPEPTVTCLGIGPITSEERPSKLRRLQLLKD